MMNDGRAVSTWISAMQQQALISNWHADVQTLMINDATLPVAIGCVKAGQRSMGLLIMLVMSVIN